MSAFFYLYNSLYHLCLREQLFIYYKLERNLFNRSTVEQIIGRNCNFETESTLDD